MRGEEFGPDSIEKAMRERIRETIATLVEEELEIALGAARSERIGSRSGYRHGTRARTLTTSLGPTTFSMPRARGRGADGEERDWRSRTIGRYERRTERVDAALLGVYLSGTNTRRIRGALAPLRRGAPLSKDAISRLVGRLREDFERWSKRDLAQHRIRYVFLDGWSPRGRIGKKRVRVPVLVTLGTTADGERVILDLRIAGEESEASWSGVIESLIARNVGRPVLAVIDGNPGLEKALGKAWPKIDIQRCTNHKLWNLIAKAPSHLREELAADDRRMIYAETAEAVVPARAAFARQWKIRCKAVFTSCEEAGDNLFTYLRYPSSPWKSLRTTNALERINEEFRRRTKTQASLPSEDAVLLLLFGLLRSGQVVLRRIVGWKDMGGAIEQSHAA
jgi:transposase-like protein